MMKVFGVQTRTVGRLCLHIKKLETHLSWLLVSSSYNVQGTPEREGERTQLSILSIRHQHDGGLVLVNPGLVLLGPGLDLVSTEPEGDLLLGVLDRVTSVADVSADSDGKVTSDGSWSGGQWVGGTCKN